MKRLALIAVALAALSAPAMATNVGVSISVGDPNFYGHIDIGNVPAPVLIQPSPIIVQPAPVGVVVQPMYLHVPPGHIKHWSKHCREYGACGRPVYFVDERWYQNVYVPQYRDHHGEWEHHERREEWHDERHDHGHDHDRDYDHGHGHGHHDRDYDDHGRR